MSLTKDLLQEIYLALNRENLLSELNPKRRNSANGEYLELDCPSCEKRGRAFIYATGIYITCNRRENCGYSMSLWDYLQQKEGLSNQETLKRLAHIAGVDLPALSEGAIVKIERTKSEAFVLEKIFCFFKETLLSDQGKPVIEYLKKRGYLEEEIRRMDFGYNPGYERTKNYLAAQKHDIEVLKYLRWRNDYPIVFPYRDAHGHIINIWGRRLQPSEEAPKYKPFCDSKKSVPFLLYKARGLDELILVEGYFDPMIACERGVKGVVGLGGASLNQDQLETLLSYKPKKITLALDQDEAGFAGTEKTIQLLASIDVDLFVVSLPDKIKDPDQCITTKGVDAFAEALTKAESAPKWAAKRIVQKNEVATDRGKRAALRQAIEFNTYFKKPLDRHEFFTTVAQELNLAKEMFDGFFKEGEEELAKEAQKKAYHQLLEQGKRCVEKGDFSGFEQLFNQTQKVSSGEARIPIIPYTIENLQKDLKQAKEGLRTGYSRLDEFVRIQEGSIALVAGRPSHGKTTFMLNLFLNMISCYPDLNFYFFSYEETKAQIAVKLVNILAEYVFQEAHNLPNIQGYLKSYSTSIPAIEEAKETYDLLVSSGRLKVIGEPYYVSDLVDVIRELKEKEPIGAVFIDYIQKIKNPQKFGTRQLELQKTSERLLEGAKDHAVPIVLGAQLGRSPDTRDKVKLDNLREAGDFEQDANLVLGLFNSAMEKSQEIETPINDRVVDLNVTPLKNRNGVVNKTITLEFDRPILKIREKPLPEML